jgi:hypothetical protein
MTNVEGFERRLLQALIEVDERRLVSKPSAVGPADAGHRGPRRRTRRPVTLVAAAVVLICSMTAVAAASGLFSAAPPGVQRIFAGLSGSSGHEVDAGQAVRIGVIDEHDAYAAPTGDGGFCLYFAPNPRSGPTGTDCIPRGAGPDEAVFSLLIGTDGGLIFGRVGADAATTVVITFLDHTIVRTPVAEAGFFGAPIPDSALDAMMIETPPGPKDPPTKDGGPIRSLDLSRITAISVTATDPTGTPVAHGLTSPTWVH